jgi:hypothetical protein
MNKMRRKELMEWVKKAKDWATHGEELKSELENICSDEQDYFDNMPENLQGSQRGMDAEEAIDAMNEAIESMDNAIEAAEEAASCIEDI